MGPQSKRSCQLSLLHARALRHLPSHFLAHLQACIFSRGHGSCCINGTLDSGVLSIPFAAGTQWYFSVAFSACCWSAF